MKFIFTTICDVDGTKTSVEFDSSTWPESVDRLINLLKASGYTISDDAVGLNSEYPTAEGYFHNLTTFEQEQ